jgi:hypothetical protein
MPTALLAHDVARRQPYEAESNSLDICRADDHVQAYLPCTASRVRFAGSRFTQPALDPAPDRDLQALRPTSTDSQFVAGG